VLGAIGDGLRIAGAQSIEIHERRLTFRARQSPLRLRGGLAFIARGSVEVEERNGRQRLRYRIWYSVRAELLAIGMVLGMAVAMRLAGGFTLSSLAWFAGVGYLYLFGGNVILACSRFRRILRRSLTAAAQEEALPGHGLGSGSDRQVTEVTGGGD
jgi:hypothetical protein